MSITELTEAEGPDDILAQAAKLALAIESLKQNAGNYPLVATLKGDEVTKLLASQVNENGEPITYGKPLVDAAKKYFEAHLRDQVVDHPIVGKISINKKQSWHKTGGYAHGSLIHAKLIPAILDILSKGLFIGAENPKPGRKDDAKQFYYIGAKVSVEGKVYTISLSIIEFERGKFAYNLLENPVAQLERKLEAIKKAIPENPPSASISTLDQSGTTLYDSSVDDDQTIFNIHILNTLTDEKPRIIEGRQNKVKTAKGTRLDTNLAVIDAKDLIASHDALGNANPDYPQELQPRDRSRQSSQQQIHSIANDLDPDSLGRSNRADSGAPIIGSDRVVESGNGRTIAIKLAYQQGKADDYKDWILENAEYFGVNPAQVEAMEQPILVRVRKTEIDRAQFAVEANQDDKLSYSATERAKTDAKRISGALLDLFNPGENGDLLAASNLKFIQAFLHSLGEHEAAQYTTTDGKPTQALIIRIKSAIFSKAYNDDRLLEMVADQTKPDLQNILNALSVSAPKFIEAQAANQATKGHIEDVSTSIVDSIEKSLDIRIVNAILDATNVIEKAKQSNQDIAEYVDQLGLFGDYGEGVPELAVFISNNNRSAKKLSIAFKAMAEFAERTAVESQNFGLFGEPEPVNIKDAVAYANEALNKEYGNQEQVDFFDSAADLEEAAKQSATSPDNDLPEPTEQEKIEGNYIKGKVRIDDLVIAIENPAGSVREGTDQDGNHWQNEMMHHYGYIEGTMGADGDELDVFIKKGMTDFNGKVFVIFQVDPVTQKFDEHKLVLGADSEAEAEEIYLSNYENGWDGFKSITELTIDELKAKLATTWTKTTALYDDAQGMEAFISAENNTGKMTPHFLNSDSAMNENALEALQAVDAKAHPLNALNLALSLIMFRGTEPAFVQADPTVNYTTKKGKVLQGIVIPFDTIKYKRDAAELDPYTFIYEQQGWFVRAKHLANIDDQFLTPEQINLKRGNTHATNSDGSTFKAGETGRGPNDGGSSADERPGPNDLAGESSQGNDGRGDNGNGTAGLSDNNATGSGTGSNRATTSKRKRGIAAANLAADEGKRSDVSDGTGSHSGTKRDRSLVQSAKTTRANLTGKALLQADAEGSTTEWADIESIRTSLPYLLSEQQDDVHKVEERLINGNKNGILVTNGTGTGKTFTGLGTVKRFVNSGKKNVLIVSMNDKIVRDFVKSAKALHLDVHQLDGINDNGGEEHSIVATTYANLAQNQALADKDWDLIVVDEAHNLMQSQDGRETAALHKLRALTGHHRGFQTWFDNRFRNEQPPRKKIETPVLDEQGNPVKNADGTDKIELIDGGYEEGPETQAWYDKQAEFREKWKDSWRQQTPGRTKVIFLTATPWSYIKTVDWAEGYLFDFEEPANLGKKNDDGSTYNSGDSRERFYMSHFGYTMRYNKLTQPGGKVDSGVNERFFAEKLKGDGAMFGRELDVPFDYDRKFILVKSAAGQEIDRGLDILWEERIEGTDKRAYADLSSEVRSRFDYLSRERLLEAIKADAAIEQIKKQIALGRKVVVFHDYNDGGGFSPFNFENKRFGKPGAEGEYARFSQKYPDLVALDLSFESPIDTLLAHFPNALLFNGRISKGIRSKNADLFNTDKNGKNLIIVQSDAGATGISFHDTTGVHQRAIYNLGLPKKPAKLRQTEGRIYRVGQASNAIQRYLTTGTKWETEAFANVIAQRAETVDNLAKGEAAVVSIRDAIITAYQNAEYFEPSLNDGIGGKAYDEENARIAKLSPFDKALTFYYNKGKNRDSRQNKIGKDWYATPEPLGLKMVEWAGVHKGDDVLEPSAGDGAIGRWIPADANGTMIEPSSELAARAQMANTSANIEKGTFENHHTMIKYDAVVMNPPFGNAGKIALEHVIKACKHLREGGRVVALVPRSPNLDKGLEAFLESHEGREFYLGASVLLPSSTFVNANTSVNTRIIILERHELPENAPQFREMDLSKGATVEHLFEDIKEISFSPRKLRNDEALLEYGLIMSPFRNTNILTGVGVKDPVIRANLQSNYFVYEVTNDPDSLECAARNVKKLLAGLKAADIPKLMPHNQDGYDSWQHDGIYERVPLGQVKVDLSKYVRLEKNPTLQTPVVLVDEGHNYRLISGYERFKMAKIKHESYVPAIIVGREYTVDRAMVIAAYKKTANPLDVVVFAKNLFEALDDEAEKMLAS